MQNKWKKSTGGGLLNPDYLREKIKSDKLREKEHNIEDELESDDLFIFISSTCVFLSSIVILFFVI